MFLIGLRINVCYYDATPTEFSRVLCDVFYYDGTPTKLKYGKR